ncbi:MAG: bifunctional diaminohydroxyphosphoribosylaminopyrimidine deaminase/5-amino-6-(5-phosphoribosylamino)uracil reductase RibD [Desulforhopalus sp.]
MTESQDKQFMRLALKQAQKGVGRTSPNPCVGAVIVKDGEVIAQGYHKKSGSPHAEIHALRNASESVLGASIYVTLEPCNHTGKTPPCSQAILEHGLSRVVIGMPDPNPLVNGGGIDFLKSHGIEVISGVLEQECMALNSPFIKHITQGIPWTIMKAGVSLDGRLNYQSGDPGWITGEQSAHEVHKLRNTVDAILVGKRTVDIDNPSLTTRLARGRIKDPIRIILDSDLTTSLSSKVYRLESKAPTWVVCSADAPQSKMARFQKLGIKVIGIKHTGHGLDLHQLLKELGKENICSLLVEGGARLHGAFLREKLYDYAQLFYAPLFAGDHGVSLNEGYSVENRNAAPRLTNTVYKKLGEDILISGQVCYQ